MKQQIVFPKLLPDIKIKKSNAELLPLKCEEFDFIIAKAGYACSEGVYDSSEKTLKKAIHRYAAGEVSVSGVCGIMIRADTVNFTDEEPRKTSSSYVIQITSEYIRRLCTIYEDDTGTEHIKTFLDDNFDVIKNGNDNIHGVPIIIYPNEVREINGVIYIKEKNLRYTLGVYDLTIGNRVFNAIRLVTVMDYGKLEESYIDNNGRQVLTRVYCMCRYCDDSSKQINVNNVWYRLSEEHLSAYAF